jgi:hypothetical protein
MRILGLILLGLVVWILPPFGLLSDWAKDEIKSKREKGVM